MYNYVHHHSKGKDFARNPYMFPPETHLYIKSLAEKAAQDAHADFTYKAPVFVIVTTEQDNPGGIVDCACAIENMLLAAHALGLGACWLNQLPRLSAMPPARALMDSLGIPQDHTIHGTFALGHPAKLPAQPTDRKNSTFTIIG